MTAKNLALSWGMLTASVVCNILGTFIVKRKLNELGAFPTDSLAIMLGYFWQLVKAPLVVCGIALTLNAPVLSAVALSRMDISIYYPAQIGMSLVLMLLLAIIFLGESITLNKLIGIGLVFASIYFIYE